jgi:hypothetical protein
MSAGNSFNLFLHHQTNPAFSVKQQQQQKEIAVLRRQIQFNHSRHVTELVGQHF